MISARTDSQDHSFPSKRAKPYMEFPDDLIHEILSRSDFIDIVRSSCISRRWAEASAHKDYWNFLNFENCSNVTEEQFTKICQRYADATELNLYGVSAMNSLASKARCSLMNLESLHLGKGRLDCTFHPALRQFAALKRLSVRDATFEDKYPFLEHKGLQILEIVNCNSVFQLSVRCVQLEILSLKRMEMVISSITCPKLRKLEVVSCRGLSDSHIWRILTSCPLLESVDVSYSLKVTDETLSEIARRCTNLVSLNASGNEKITFLSVSFPTLKYLKLLHCSGLTQDSIAAISSYNSLEILELGGVSASVTCISLNSQHLQSIRLTDCEMLYELNLKAPMLSFVKISECPSLHQISIFSKTIRELGLPGMKNLSSLSVECQVLEEIYLTACEMLCELNLKAPMLSFVKISECPSLHQISIFSKTIRELGLPGMKNLSSLSLECQVLEEIYLTACEKLTSFSHNFEVDCPSLKSLVLESCRILTEVTLRSSSLTHLSLADNHALISLELDCPYLEQLHLDNCCNLKRALLCPVGLQSLNLGICPKLHYLQIEAPQMDMLELKGCGELSEISTCCPVLNSLDASFCSQLTDDCLRKTTSSSSFIESLTLTACSSIGADGLASLQYLVHLTNLDLSYTILTNLQPVFESCLQLKVLILQACKDLADSSLEPLYKNHALPFLQELDLSHGRLSQFAITELLACCSRLMRVNLNGCVNIHDFDRCASISPPGDNTRCLQSLNCVGCLNIKKFSLPIEAHFSLLLSLNLSLSRNLKEVDIVSPSLRDLNLSRCGSLGNLKLDCPRLTSLFLQSSSVSEIVLDTAISQCTMLATLDVRGCPKMNPGSKGRLRAANPSLRCLLISTASA